MTAPTTTQQLYKVMRSHHREAMRDTTNGIDFVLDLQERVTHAYNADVRAKQDLNRTMKIGFGLCAALIVGIGAADYMEMKNLDNLTRTSIDYRNVIISVQDRQAYMVGFWDDSDCPHYEVWPLNTYNEYGAPVRTGKPVATFSLPGMPECKP